MKNKMNYVSLLTRLFIAAIAFFRTSEAAAQCANYVYGLTNVGMIQRVDVATGTTAAALNPAHTGNAASLSNAIGYNPLNGKYYFFKRNAPSAPQEFVSFDPATNLYAMLAPSPVGTSNIVNLGAVNNSGLGYYCFDAFGVLYYYSVAANTWTTICSNVKDQSGTTMSAIIGAGSLNRIYGDIAFDGNGNLWMLVSGAADYGLYKISGPLPTTAVANLTATQIIAPNTASPAGTFGGMAFSATGSMFLSSNSPSNKLYKLSTISTLAFVANLSVDGIGNDLTSCNFPLTVLATNGVKLSASTVNGNVVMLNWNLPAPAGNTGYTVEHSINGSSWNQIHYLLKTADDASSSFSFSQSIFAGGTQYYRIKITDETGVITYSNIATANTVSRGSSISIWPNPVQTALKIQSAGPSTAIICDNAGRVVSSSVLASGVNTLPVKALNTGTYIVSVKLANGVIVNQKFVKQ